MTTISVQETAWPAGNLASRVSTHASKRVLFGEMFEDAQIEVEAFRGRGKVFSIASAGNTAIRLAQEHEVVACDINRVQLACQLMPLGGWHHGLVEAFLALTDPHEQLDFWRAHLDTRRFRAGFDFLLSYGVLRMLYAPQFLSFLPVGFGPIMRRRWERCFAEHPNATNPYARLLLLGDASALNTPPPSPQTGTIEFVEGDAAGYLECCAAESFGGFALSNILDGARPGYRLRLQRAVLHAAAPGAIITLRSFGEPLRALRTNLAARDRSMLWGVVDVRPVEDIYD